MGNRFPQCRRICGLAVPCVLVSWHGKWVTHTLSTPDPPHLLPHFTPTLNTLFKLLPREQVLAQQLCPPSCSLKLMGKAEQRGVEQSMMYC